MFELNLPELVSHDVSGIVFYTDDLLFDATGIRIAFTSRLGGVSKDEYAELNLGLHVQDDPDCVLENRRLTLQSVGATDKVSLICPNQVHGDHVCLVSSTEPFIFEAARDEAVAGSDALVVTCKDVCAMLCYADCVPVILASSAGSFAVIHAGWRGVVARICSKALEALCEASKVSPDCVNAYIGPYIHSECFEVGDEVYSIFEEEFKSDIDSICINDDHVDLGAAIKATLIDAGMEYRRIADLNLCTSCNSELFFSYRAQNGKCGRHSALAFRS